MPSSLPCYFPHIYLTGLFSVATSLLYINSLLVAEYTSTWSPQFYPGSQALPWALEESCPLCGFGRILIFFFPNPRGIPSAIGTHTDLALYSAKDGGGYTGRECILART